MVTRQAGLGSCWAKIKVIRVCYPNATGTITNLAVDGGLCDFTKSQQARMVSNAPQVRGGEIRYDPNVVTLTASPAGPSPLSLKKTS